jgi:lipid-A-disaccharide synthase
MLENMLTVIPKFSNFQFVIAGVGNLDVNLYSKAIKHGVRVIFDQTYDLLSHASAAIVTSGTATLETAIFKVPQIVVYKTSSISYWIGKKLIRVPYISLVNLIGDKMIVQELIQNDFNSENLSIQLQKILSEPQSKVNMLIGYAEVLENIGQSSASETTANLIVQSIKS